MPRLTKRHSRKVHGTKKSKKQMGGRSWREYFRLPPSTPWNKIPKIEWGPVGVGMGRRPYTLKNAANINKFLTKLDKMSPSNRDEVYEQLEKNVNVSDYSPENLQVYGQILRKKARNRAASYKNNKRSSPKEYGNNPVNINDMMKPY